MVIMKFLKYSNPSAMNLYFYFVINVMYKNLERNKSRCNNYGAIILYCQINKRIFSF